MRQSDDSSRNIRRKRKRRHSENLDAELAHESAARRRRRWPWIALGLFLLGLYLLPNLASSGTVRSWLVESVSEGYPVQIEVEGASAGWFSPIVLTGVHVRDLDGEPLLDAERITCRSALSSLMFNSHAPGVVRVEQPVMLVRMSGGSSNWERAIAQLPPPETDQPLDLDAAVEVVDGTIIIEDTFTGQSSELQQVNGRVDYPRGDYKPLTAKITAAVIGYDEQNPGQLDLDGEWFLAPHQSADWGSGQVALTLGGIPLEATSPLLKRADLATSAQGTLQAQLTASRGDQGGPIHIELKQLSATQLHVIQPTMIPEPQLALRHASLVGTFDIQADRLSWNGVQFTGDLGNMTSAGGVNFNGWSVGNYEAAFAGYPQHLDGRLEIAALARTFPHILSIRDDVRFQAGQAAFHFDNGLVDHEGHGQIDRNQPGAATKWAGSVQIENIQARTSDGQVHTIPPARLSVRATNTPTGITLDSLEGQGEFFALRASGNTVQGQLTGNVSLDKLQQELQGVINLQGVQLAGQAEIRANWSRGEQNLWGAAANARMTDWKLTLPDQGVWQEPNLTLNGSLTGLMPEGSLQQIQQGEITISAGADLFTAQLLQAVNLTGNAADWPLSYTLEGDASRWQTRLAAFLPMRGMRVDGQLNAGGQLVYGANQIAWQNFQLHAEPLIITTANLRIDEPVTDIDSTGVYSLADSSLNVQQMKLVSTSVSLQASQVQANLAADPPVATGQAAFRGDWSRISRWFAQPTFNNQPVPWKMEGSFEGNATLAAQNDRISGNLSMTNRDTAFYQLEESVGGSMLASSNIPQWKLAWKEPEATVAGKLSYRPQVGLMQLENLSIASNMLQFAMSGSVSDMSGKSMADLKGTMQYDLAKLSTFLQTQLGTDFQLSGTKQSEFYIRGPLHSDLKMVSTNTYPNQPSPQPLVSPQLEAGGGLAWDGANLYGLPVGASSINSKLQQSVLLIDPINVPISQGRLRVNSKLYLYEPTPTLAIEKGRIVDNVEITPQMCRAWLKYVAPLTADVTRVQGRLALDLNDSQVPLGTPQQANTSGTLSVSNAQIGPGPLSEVVIYLGQRVQALATGNPAQAAGPQSTVWVNVPQQQIPFAVREGRVYHENMQMNVGVVQVTTNGSVGFDQSLSMMAEVPIRAEWFRGQRGLLSSFAGKNLQIPIKGSLTQPQIDSQIFEQIARQQIQGAANDLLNEGIRQGFGRLFGPSQQP